MYQVVNKEGVFHVLDGDDPVFTPAGNPVCTEHRTLADKLVEHFENYGTNNGDQHSIALFHYPMLDFVSCYPREDIVQSLILAFDPYNDWTFHCTLFNDAMRRRWFRVFGVPETQIPEGREWLEELNANQLCAVMVLSKALGSVNIPFQLTGFEQKSQILAFAREIVMFRAELGQLPLQEMFLNFMFYWEL